MTSARTKIKDCRTCRLRRIRCDRTTPTCVKCAKKGLDCPGFRPQVRWTNAIASRGQYKGMGAPCTGYDGVNTPGPKHAGEACGSQGVEIQYGLTCEHELFDGAVSDQLMRCYISDIAPSNVWIDSNDNCYKSQLVPLAKTQRHLQLAIVSIAAAVSAPRHLKTGLSLSHAAYRKAVWLVTEQMRTMTGMELSELHGYVDANSGTAEAVLAATLVLANASLVESDLQSAFLHLQAARVLIQTLAAHTTVKDSLFVFLRNQVAALDIISCTTIFDLDHIQNAIRSEIGHGDVMFGQYLNIIHDITLQSLHEWNDEQPQATSYIFTLEDDLQVAQGLTLLAAGRLTEKSNKSYQRDVTRLVQAYHHAALVYACKRLTLLNSHQIEERHVAGLFRSLARFEDLNAWVPNLVWPIFVGGITSFGNPERMQFIRNLCQILLNISPYKYYATIPAFFEELWATTHGKWSIIAREWQAKGTPVLAI